MIRRAGTANLAARRRGQEGAALVAAIVIMGILATGATATWRLMHLRHDQIHREHRSQEAWHIAEGGVEAAVAALRLDQSFPGETDAPLGWGRYSTRVETAPDGGYVIHATGQRSDGELVRAEAQLRALLRLDAAGRVVAYSIEEARP